MYIVHEPPFTVYAHSAIELKPINIAINSTESQFLLGIDLYRATDLLNHVCLLANGLICKGEHFVSVRK